MGILLNASAPDNEVKRNAPLSVAVHTKLVCAVKAGFVTLTKHEVETKRRSAYTYAF